MVDTQHTPTPWLLGRNGITGIIIYAHPEQGNVVNIHQIDEATSQQVDNAHLILKAVNCHDELLAALRLIMEGSGIDTWEGRIAHDAISKAERA